MSKEDDIDTLEAVSAFRADRGSTPSGTETEGHVHVDESKTKAVLACLERSMQVRANAENGNASVEEVEFLATISAHLSDSLKQDHAEFKQRVDARKKRSENAKRARGLDPIYQQTANFIRETEPGGVFLSKRKIADKVHTQLEDLIRRGKLTIEKVAPAETIRKHIK